MKYRIICNPIKRPAPSPGWGRTFQKALFRDLIVINHPLKNTSIEWIYLQRKQLYYFVFPFSRGQRERKEGERDCFWRGKFFPWRVDSNSKDDLMQRNKHKFMNWHNIIFENWMTLEEEVFLKKGYLLGLFQDELIPHANRKESDQPAQQRSLMR